LLGSKNNKIGLKGSREERCACPKRAGLGSEGVGEEYCSCPERTRSVSKGGREEHCAGPKRAGSGSKGGREEGDSSRRRTGRESENVARRTARTADLAIRNERMAYVQQNSPADERSRNDRTGEGGNDTTRARRPAAAAHDRSFSPDTDDRIPSCLEEEYPRFASATEEFPPEITKENLRQRYNDYQNHIDWCANRSPCGICGGSFQSDSVSLYSQWSWEISTSWTPVRSTTMASLFAIPVAIT
jgi:hypothetical protein